MRRLAPSRPGRATLPAWVRVLALGLVRIEGDSLARSQPVLCILVERATTVGLRPFLEERVGAVSMIDMAVRDRDRK